ncbi:unnamed protein product [Fusarium venenatum]|uniref:Uncharacterized protein n=1 Tax=Fusarium venenatum TaxID=56646 RepID=A0A2L2TFH8_9HYPO|nr:uncharacterized protein FVRRES_07603 [Fusarium venenatum]CEI63167.1 unnamed protein product [Fusarium venenatum]
MIRWYGPERFNELWGFLSTGFPKELLDQESAKQFPTGCEDDPTTPDSPGKLAELQHELLAEDHAVRNMMHCVVCEDDLFYFVPNNYSDLANIGPFPWHLE